MDDFKRDDPNIIPPTNTYQERVVVERGGNAAVWWVLGILVAAVLFGAFYFLTRPAVGPTDADLRAAQAEAAADSARQTAEAALTQSQISSARDSVAVAQAQSATARAEAARAAAEARAAEARAAAPVVVERQPDASATPNGATPQPGN